MEHQPAFLTSLLIAGLRYPVSLRNHSPRVNANLADTYLYVGPERGSRTGLVLVKSGVCVGLREQGQT